MSIKNVALIGGTGTIGAPMLPVLKSSSFNVSVLNRQSSKSTYPDTHVISIPDDLNVPDLTRLLRENSIDALIIAIEGKHVKEQKRLIEAAFNSGVKRVIPADFGSCDSANDKTVELLPLMAGKKSVREYLTSLEDKERGADEGKLSWTSLITGHFFDFGLTCDLLKFDIPHKKAFLIDGGDIKFSASDLDFIVKAVVKVLEKPAETANRLLYIHSHYVTQREVLAALEKVSGQKWETVEEDSERLLKAARPKMLEGDHDAGEEVVAVWGIVASDWKDKEGFANDLLGLKEKDLEETVRRVIEKQQGKF